MRLRLVMLLFAMVWCGPSEAMDLFGPKNYNECILKNIDKAKTRNAAAMVMNSCRNIFPIEPVKLTPDQIKEITTAGVTYQDGEFVISLRNEIPSWTVTEIHFAVFEDTEKEGAGPRFIRAQQVKEGTMATAFSFNVSMRPYETAKFSIKFNANSGKVYGWMLFDVIGYQE